MRHVAFFQCIDNGVMWLCNDAVGTDKTFTMINERTRIYRRKKANLLEYRRIIRYVLFKGGIFSEDLLDIKRVVHLLHLIG
jgi:hypothetical protein